MYRNFAVWFFVVALALFGVDRYLDREHGRDRLAPSEAPSGSVHAEDDGSGFPPPSR
jgi:hypothetical protein